jgi:hypothetical protein
MKKIGKNNNGGKNMIIKNKTIIMTVLFVLSLLTVGWNFGIAATEDVEEQDSGDATTTTTRQGSAIYHWGEMEVISEPLKGQNWNSESSYEPKIAVEGIDVHVVWWDQTELQNCGSDSDIFYRKFDGTQWSNIEVISEPVMGEDNNDGGSNDPEIVVENGNIYVVWYDYTDWDGSGGDSEIFFRCKLSGSDWGPIQVVSEPVSGQDNNANNSWNPGFSVSNGKIYVVWDDQNATGTSGDDRDIFYRCNLTGTGWEDIQVISEPIYGLDQNDGNSWDGAVFAENNDVYVVWEDQTELDNSGYDRDIFYRCNLTGSSWEDIQIISEPVAGANISINQSHNAELVVENGNIYVVWQDENDFDNCMGDADVFYRCNLTSKPGWEGIQVISENVTGDNYNDQTSSYPRIDVENGDIYVIWEDNSNWDDTTGDSDIFYRNNLTGSGWNGIEILSEAIVKARPVGGADNPDIAVLLGKCHVVWETENNTYGAGTDNDIFYRCTFIPPELTLPGVTPTIGDTGTGFNFTVTYIDVDNEAPTKMVINISGIEYQMLEVDPGDMNYRNGKMYYLNTTLPISPDHTFIMQTSDGTYSEDILPIDAPDVLNTIPVITTIDNNTAYEDLLYEVDYEYDDIDIVNVGQIGTWSLNTDASWLEINETSGVLSGTPTQAHVGDYWVNVTINDTIDMDSTNFTLDVNPVNDPPSLITDVLLMAQEDEFYEVTFEAEDVDTSKLFWVIATNATWLNVKNSLGSINGTPLNEHVGGEFWVNVMVEDGEFMDHDNFTLVVNNTNDPPEIQPMELVVPQVGTPYSMVFIAEDIDPPPTIFTWGLETNADSWLKINATTGEIYGTPTENDIGEFWLNVSVDDGTGGSDHVNLTLNVELGIINLDPAITTDDVTYTLIEEQYLVDYEGTDDRTDPLNLTWDLETNATWLSINASSGELRGIPSTNDSGEYGVKIYVYDGEGGSAVSNFTLTVGTVPLNNAPELSAGRMSPASGDTDTTFYFTVTYTDEDSYAGNVSIWIDGVEHKMKPDPADTDDTDGVNYIFQTKLGEGEHDYYFTGDDGELDAVSTDITPTTSTDAESTPSVTESKGDDKEAGEGDENWWIWVLLTFIIMLILVFVAFAIGKRQGAGQAYGHPSEEAPPAEEPEEEWEDGEEEEEEEWEEADEDEDAADEEMDEEMEDEEDWDDEDETEDEDEDIDEEETEDESKDESEDDWEDEEDDEDEWDEE